MSEGRIFISYRRSDSAYAARALNSQLSAAFGDDKIFMDVEDIELGVDFGEKIQNVVASCDILLVVMGPDWLTVTDQQGGRRIDNPDDWVRLEVSAALERDVRVIPVLVKGAPVDNTRYV